MRYKKRKPQGALVATFGSVLAILLLVNGAAPAAADSLHRYWAGHVDYGQYKYGGSKSMISGGQVKVPLSIQYLRAELVTYYSYPGYNEVHRSSGPGPGWHKVWHGDAPNAYTKCRWIYGEDIGPIYLTCDWRG